MNKKKRIRKLLRILSLILPFALPTGVFVIWIAAQCRGQESRPLHIVASMDLDGGMTTIFSTTLPDGNEAVWECSDGAFMETGDIIAQGRTVTWQPHPGLEDSVSIVITTPSFADTVRFLPVIPDVIPSLTISAAYHLAILERARSIQIAPGNYRVISYADALRGYDGLTVLIVTEQRSSREAFCMLPGDTVEITLPLGGVVQGVGLDNMENAMNNSGNVRIVFETVDVNITETEEEPVENENIDEQVSPEPSMEPSSPGEEP